MQRISQTIAASFQRSGGQKLAQMWCKQNCRTCFRRRTILGFFVLPQETCLTWKEILRQRAPSVRPGRGVNADVEVVARWGGHPLLQVWSCILYKVATCSAADSNSSVSSRCLQPAGTFQLRDANLMSRRERGQPSSHCLSAAGGKLSHLQASSGNPVIFEFPSNSKMIWVHDFRPVPIGSQRSSS